MLSALTSDTVRELKKGLKRREGNRRNLRSESRE